MSTLDTATTLDLTALMGQIASLDTATLGELTKGAKKLQRENAKAERKATLMETRLDVFEDVAGRSFSTTLGVLDGVQLVEAYLMSYEFVGSKDNLRVASAWGIALSTEMKKHIDALKAEFGENFLIAKADLVYFVNVMDRAVDKDGQALSGWYEASVPYQKYVSN
jgi:hypothetical protein